jgi:hypothetical protein
MRASPLFEAAATDAGGQDYSRDQIRWNTSVPLVPPKPNEFDSTMSTFRSRATWGT